MMRKSRSRFYPALACGLQKTPTNKNIWGMTRFFRIMPQRYHDPKLVAFNLKRNKRQESLLLQQIGTRFFAGGLNRRRAR
jgi:hypothetical protein